MAHPSGGSGSRFCTKHTFEEVYNYIGVSGCIFKSTTGEKIQAKQSLAKDKVTKIVVYIGASSRHGSACEACWGFRNDCNRSWIGHCTETLDKLF